MAKKQVVKQAEMTEFEKDLLESIRQAREPSGAARTLLRIALKSPEVILQAG